MRTIHILCESVIKSFGYNVKTLDTYNKLVIHCDLQNDNTNEKVKDFLQKVQAADVYVT